MNKCTLSINGFELPVYLGWPDAERQQAQTVRVDLVIQLKKLPKACETDQLQDTFCYDTLLEHLRAKIYNRQFHLIEYLTKEIHTIIKTMLPVDCQLTVSTLKFPAISGLSGGVTFTYAE